MPFPENIDRIFEDYGVPGDTKQAVYDLYVSMGEEALDVFGEIAEGVESPAELRPEDTLQIRERVALRYLEKNHGQWMSGRPTASFWRPREMEGRAGRIGIPLCAAMGVVEG